MEGSMWTVHSASEQKMAVAAAAEEVEGKFVRPFFPEVEAECLKNQNKRNSLILYRIARRQRDKTDVGISSHSYH